MFSLLTREQRQNSSYKLPIHSGESIAKQRGMFSHKVKREIASFYMDNPEEKTEEMWRYEMEKMLTAQKRLFDSLQNKRKKDMEGVEELTPEAKETINNIADQIGFMDSFKARSDVQYSQWTK